MQANNPPEDAVAILPPGAMAHGVSVVSLGDDPKVMDFFAGTYWVRRFPDGRNEMKNMLPADANIEWAQPTIADIDGDGKAEVIFGLSDGRIFVYQTGCNGRRRMETFCTLALGDMRRWM